MLWNPIELSRSVSTHNHLPLLLQQLSSLVRTIPRNYEMEKTNFGYSLKNIPIPSKQSYIKSMIAKTQNFLKRLRWKAHFYDNPSSAQQKENYGFSSDKTPPQIKDLIPFENDMFWQTHHFEIALTWHRPFLNYTSPFCNRLNLATYLYIGMNTYL